MPLNALTSDNVPFLWTSECEDAFVQLKAKLISEPILKFADLNLPFFVEVDASNHAVGGILSQKGLDEKLHPVAYFSTALQKDQKNWSAANKEAFALVLAVRHWNVYSKVAEYHNIAHLGIDRVYSLLIVRYYWPNIYAYIRSFISSCETCQCKKCSTAPPKAPLVKMLIPSAPMQFIPLDIAYLPKDSKG